MIDTCHLHVRHSDVFNNNSLINRLRMDRCAQLKWAEVHPAPWSTTVAHMELDQGADPAPYGLLPGNEYSSKRTASAHVLPRPACVMGFFLGRCSPALVHSGRAPRG